MTDDESDLFDDFLHARGHAADVTWGTDHEKKVCPECGGINAADADRCSSCGWESS